MAQVTEVTDATFDAEVVQADTLVAAEFYGQFCPVCKRVTPVFEGLSDEYSGRVKFVKADVSEAGQSARKLAVMSVPTIILIKGGQEIDRNVGPADKTKLATMIDAKL